MSTTKIRSGFLLLCSGLLAAALFTDLGLSQSTNLIPKSVFLTDNERLFWIKPSGERVVSLRAIKEAEQSPESHPSDQDPQGHWGQITNGFQLSLRLTKYVFTNGEPINAVILIRNVTDTPQTYFKPVTICLTRNGKALERRDDNRPIRLNQVNMPPMKTLFPQTQDRYVENISQIYNLSEPGEYILKAVCGKPSVVSQSVSVTIGN